MARWAIRRRGGTAHKTSVGRSADTAATSRRATSEAGFTLVELIVAFTILLALTAMAVPAARSQIRREHERELRNDLREMRAAIDKYKDQVDLGKIQMENDTFGYPKTLQILVDGVPVQGQLSQPANRAKYASCGGFPKIR